MLNISASSNRTALKESLEAAASAMFFDSFALAHHPRSRGGGDVDLRIHTYPHEWETRYDRHDLGLSDPIHRASHVWACGFRWRDIRSIISMSEQDHAMLEAARAFGIVEGYTVPTNVPGEPHGSVTFAVRDSTRFPEDMLFLAEGFGRLAFQTARIIDGQRPLARAPLITDRELEVVLWVGHDKTNSEIGEIMGIRPDTVMKHLRNICLKWDVVRRTSLPLRAVFEGLLVFSDILH